MKRIKQYIATVMCICMLLCSEGITVLAAEQNMKDVDTTYIDVATDTDASTSTDAIVATDLELSLEVVAEPLLNYIVIGDDYIETGEEQYVLVDIGQNIMIESATITYKNMSTGNTFEVPFDTILDTSVLFRFYPSEDGEYNVTNIQVTVEQIEYNISIEETGIDASFGVNCMVDVEPDAWVIEDEPVVVDQEGIVVLDLQAQELSCDDIATAVAEVSSGTAKAANSDGEIVVVLDPGHGNDGDPGAVYTWNGVTYYERNINLKIAEYCKAALEEYSGITVYMTRTTNDTGLRLGAADGEEIGEIVQFAADKNADILVSIHNNSSGNSSTNGSEVYYPNSNYNPQASAMGKEISELILDKLSALGLTDRGAKIRNSGDGTLYPDGSLADYYGIVRQSKLCGFPGIIIEHAFLSNESDAVNYLGSDEKLKAMGEADAAAIIEYFDLSKNPNEYKGVDYSAVFDFEYYINKYPDIKALYGNNQYGALKHFVEYGMAELRQGSEAFNAHSYYLLYPDLRQIYRRDWKEYYIHYINYGKAEGRLATGTNSLQNPVTVFEGIDYSAVYDYNEYLTFYPELRQFYENDDTGALEHFVKYGMAEGRRAKTAFDPISYRRAHTDLRVLFGYDWKQYYMHYIQYGQAEGRVAKNINKIIGPVTIYEGVDYSAVYDFEFYTNLYPDIKSLYGDDDIKALEHFVKYGMAEGRQGSSAFEIISYKNAHADLRGLYGYDWKQYYMHYVMYGQAEGRVATNVSKLQGATTVYQGIDYSAVYNFNKYKAYHPDINTLYASDDIGAIKHFVEYGMAEGRQASSSFELQSYKNAHPDLRRAFGYDWKQYYMHYVMYGQAEGRVATNVSELCGATTVYQGVDYSVVYSFEEYKAYHPDIKALYANDDIGAIKHFVEYGMAEGRQANANFNVVYYKANYPDLNNVFGNDLKSYYKHYINYGIYENRVANKTIMYGIMGETNTNVEQMVRYYNANATYPSYYLSSDASTIEDFCRIYIEECEAEGVRAEVAFCQAMKETGFLRFGGDVQIEQYNFAGLGATGNGVRGESFSSVRIGIRAQIQHLKAYASTEPLVNECVDNRFKYVNRGCAPCVEWLGIQENPYGKGWAAAKNYGYNLVTSYINKLLTY